MQLDLRSKDVSQHIPPQHCIMIDLCTVTLEPGDRATECYCLTVSCPANKKDQLVTMGDYTIQWKRYVTA